MLRVALALLIAAGVYAQSWRQPLQRRLASRLFRYLVEEMGFRAFAIESSWQGAERAASYVQTCAGTPEAAIREHINVWQSTEYADLVQWMCEWNRAFTRRGQGAAVRIRHPAAVVHGPGLIAFLQGIGIRNDHAWVARIRSCEGVVDRYPFGQIPPERHNTCIAALNAIEQHFHANRGEIVQRMTQQEFDIAMLRVIGLRAWEDSVFIIAHDFAKGYNARDIGMAYAFPAMRAMKAPGAKTVVWAANSHIARTHLPRGEEPMGSHLAAALGDDYASFALTAYETHIDFPGFGCGAVARTPGSVEDRLGRLGQKALLVDTRGRLLHRGIYAMGIDRVRPYRDYDGIIFLDRSPKMNPLVWPPCR